MTHYHYDLLLWLTISVQRTQDADQDATELRHNGMTHKQARPHYYDSFSAILNSDELQKAMVLVERIISQNIYQRKIGMTYHDS